jgi:hypothetical protein
MMEESPYNPLDKIHLGESVANAILKREPVAMPPAEMFQGAGVYAIYYTGDFPVYQSIASQNKHGKYARPIYVGKAIPAGARRGGFGLGAPPGQALYKRLLEHAESIQHATNLELDDFSCRYLVVDDIWIPLGESLLIQIYSPIWNTFLDGFGNHDPGSGRYNQQRSPWDMVHPGRSWAMRCRENARSQKEILDSLRDAMENNV